MADGPGSAFEKLLAFRRAHFEQGKEYNEAALRRSLGLPPVDNPEFLPETPERRRLVRMDDREAKREAEQAQREAQERLLAASAAVQEAAHSAARIADLERQLAEMRAALNGPGVTVVPDSDGETPAAAAVPVATVVPDGTPDQNWNKPEILRWLEENGLPLPERGGHFLSKTAVLDFALEQIEKAKGAA